MLISFKENKICEPHMNHFYQLIQFEAQTKPTGNITIQAAE